MKIFSDKMYVSVYIYVYVCVCMCIVSSQSLLFSEIVWANTEKDMQTCRDGKQEKLNKNIYFHLKRRG